MEQKVSRKGAKREQEGNRKGAEGSRRTQKEIRKAGESGREQKGCQKGAAREPKRAGRE